MAEFYYHNDGKMIGPVDGIRLREAAFSGEVTPGTMVARHPGGPWVRATKVKGLFDAKGNPLPHPSETQEFLKSLPSPPPISQRANGESPSRTANLGQARRNPSNVLPTEADALPVNPAALSSHQPSQFQPATTAVQVNVHQNSQAAHSLGISSLVLGIFSFLICWIPVIGFPLSSIGFVLGIAGLILALMRSGTGIGYSIAGAAINGVGLVLGLIFISFVTGTFQALDDAMEESASESSVQTSIGEITSAETNTRGMVNSANEPEENEGYVAIGQLYSTEDFQVSLVSASIARPEIEDYLDETRLEEDPALILTFLIRNIHERKILRYQELIGTEFRLSDDVENRIRRIEYYTGLVGALTGSEDILPGEEATHVEVFRVPPPKTEFLILTVDLAVFDGDGKVQFRIPAESIKNFEG